MAQPNGNAQAIAEAAVAAAASKPKRVRTGCLTCRERHLKCDETFPGDCLNCRKSSRVCKRGIKLNFIDTTCKRPPVMPETEEWAVDFMDESRDIASEYAGGLQQYPIRDPKPPSHNPNDVAFDYNNVVPPRPVLAHQQIPRDQDVLHHGQMDGIQQNNQFDQSNMDTDPPQPLSSINSAYSQSALPTYHAPYERVADGTSADPSSEAKEILNTREETLFMQVFVEEVGLWMDSMDSMKHFSRLLPFHALGQPMLLNALLACGVRHLTLVNPKTYKEEDALAYYDKASSLLLRALQNPERDSVICATTAVILNVYEIMTEKALPRMNHIAGARALIKECGWNARSTGIGAACFWLNVGMELLSNLHFNWQASWHPDHWGVDLDLTRETGVGREEIWAHRMVYITAKIGDFRATIPRKPQPTPRDEQIRREKRTEEWMRLKMMADAWNDNIPRTMQPMAYLRPYQTNSGSCFPEVWLIKRTTIVARLFYHTAMCLLAQVHPMMSTKTKEMHDMELYHAHQICGITAHVKDRGVASVALRSLAIAGECLTVRREQEEVMEIFKRIHKETGWRIGFIPQTMRDKWGWGAADPSPKLPTIAEPYKHLERTPKQDQQQQQQHQLQQQQMQQHQLQGQQQQQRTNSNVDDGFNLDEFDRYAMERGRQKQAQQQQYVAGQQQQAQHSSPLSTSSQASGQTPARPTPPQGIVNPMFASADFGMATHPYQEYYVAPNPPPEYRQGSGQGLGLGMGALLQGGGYHQQQQQY